MNDILKGAGDKGILKSRLATVNFRLGQGTAWQKIAGIQVGHWILPEEIKRSLLK